MYIVDIVAHDGEDGGRKKTPQIKGHYFTKVIQSSSLIFLNLEMFWPRSAYFFHAHLRTFLLSDVQ